QVDRGRRPAVHDDLHARYRVRLALSDRGGARLREPVPVLQEAGVGFDDVVKTTVFLADINDFSAMNTIYTGAFNEATAPARACVEVSRLPKDVRVEIDCIAVKN
ncbi:MAG: hypothetical protein IAF58_03025, partial [Leptolyngbya sp.]|nr:hypothetical protein [Candidatus Melainabacteria bacterium]